MRDTINRFRGNRIANKQKQIKRPPQKSKHLI